MKPTEKRTEKLHGGNGESGASPKVTETPLCTLTDEELSSEVLGCAFRVHTALGPGLLESVYRNSLAYELRQTGFNIEVEKPIQVKYLGIDMGQGFRIDILVENRLVLELKVAEKIAPNHVAQTLSYLKFSGVKYGLILNFMETKLKFGIKRVAL